MFVSFYLEQRLSVPLALKIASPFIAIAAALLIGAIALPFAGVNPFKAYEAIFTAAFFGGWFSLSDTAVKATPLILTGLACALAFRMRLWNIGAEGQLLLGAWAATGVASFWLPEDTSRISFIILMGLAAFTAGAVWGFIPGFLKAKLGVNEIITSLMMVYVALEWNNYWIYGPWSDRGFQLTPVFPREAWLPRLSDYAGSIPAFGGLTAHAGIIFGFILAVIIWVIMKHSRWGFELSVIGANPDAARYAGINVVRNTILVMTISGGIAGLAGMTEVAGVVHRLQERFSPGYGFTAIIIAWLAKLNPWGVIVVSFLFGGLLVGSKAIQPAGIPLMLQGIILFVVIASETLVHYRPRFILNFKTRNKSDRCEEKR